MSKSSKNCWMFSESRRRWESGNRSNFEWTCEGSPKSWESRRLRGSCPLSEGCIWLYA